MGEQAGNRSATGELRRGLGVWQATALNVTFIVGAGVFGTIPFMLGELPGPFALLGWLAAGALIFVDGLIWGELGAALPGSGGSYHYLLESYGRDRWGRLMAFLYVWQFLISGPLELASGLAFISRFAASLTPAFRAFNADHTLTLVLWEEQKLSVAVGPARLIALGCGLLILVLLWRNITGLARLTVALWIGVLAAIAWVLVEGALHIDAHRAFDFSGAAASWQPGFAAKVGPAMMLALYSYLGYYNVCNVGDEVRDPGRTIPRSILLSTVIVVVLFVGLHLAMLGTVPWQEALREKDTISLPAAFMERVHGPWAAGLVTLLLIGCCFGSAFAGLLGYSRVPYGAARNGHFFAVFGRVHPGHRIPHLALLLVGGLMLFWSFFDVENLISALLTTRLLEQFMGQAAGAMLLRRRQPQLPRPFRMWLYPLPCLLALAGWLFVYLSSGLFYIALGAGTLAAGAAAFLLWAWYTGGWPFAAPPVSPLPAGATDILPAGAKGPSPDANTRSQTDSHPGGRQQAETDR